MIFLVQVGFLCGLRVEMPPRVQPKHGSSGAKGGKDHSVSLMPVRGSPGGRVEFAPVPACWEANVELVREVLSGFRGLTNVRLVRSYTGILDWFC